jgi:hypothetical protein
MPHRRNLPTSGVKWTREVVTEKFLSAWPFGFVLTIDVKTEMKQEAPSSFLPPEASQLKPDRQQFQSRKRPYEENRGRGYFEHREDRRWVWEAVVTIVLVSLCLISCAHWEGLSSIFPALPSDCFLYSLSYSTFLTFWFLPHFSLLITCRTNSKHLSFTVWDANLLIQPYTLLLLHFCNGLFLPPALNPLIERSFPTPPPNTPLLSIPFCKVPTFELDTRNREVIWTKGFCHLLS